jgi:predicted RNase H-like HicB family nuclease
MKDYKYVIKKEKVGYSAYCKELDICSQGMTIKEAEYNLNEAIILYFETLEELNLNKMK